MEGLPLAKPYRLLSRVSVLAAVLAVPAWPADPVFDNKGFNPNREFVSQLPFEHIDPLTGNLLLTFTDLELPGNAGFNLRVQRTYNSKIYSLYSNLGGYSLAEDSWAGLGWTLHFGRVLEHNAISPGPIIEMPDGSRHQTYPHKDGVLAALSGHYITREHWTYERIGTEQGRLRLPNGVTYFFGSARGDFLYATEISDPFGNEVVVNYPPLTFFTRFDWIDSVELRPSTGEVRKVTFTWNEQLPYAGSLVDQRPAGSLATMTYRPGGTQPARIWTHVQKLKQPHNGMTLLNEVHPPLGPPWKFEYDETGAFVADNAAPYGLKAVTTPNGGRIEYAFQPQLFKYGSTVVYSPVLRTRTVSGAEISPGTWHYDFDSPGFFEPVTALVVSPCNKIRYTTRAIGPPGDEKPWAIGALARKETLDLDGSVLETEVLEWTASAPLSDFPESGNSFTTHMPLLSERTLTRGGKTYRTTYTYDDTPYNQNRASNFNDFGRAREILEDGESGILTRKTTRTFFYGSSTDPSFGTYIVDKLASETVRAPANGSEAFTSSYEYETTGGYRGFLKSQAIRGIVTTYTSDTVLDKPTGNVKTAEDGNHHVTSYAYVFGVAREIKTPLYTITRVINDDGTIASETRRGFTTKFEYDALARPTRRTPPLGSPTTTQYDNGNGRTVMTTRGPSTVTTTLDGLGRAVATANNLSTPVKTSLRFDACGRQAFGSYPFTGNPGTALGSSYTYDALGRTTSKTDPGDEGGTTTVEIRHPSGVNVEIVDENGHMTSQTWAAFGDPEDRRLLSVRDAANEITAYTYNTLGALRSVTHPSGPGRGWAYYGQGESGGTPGLLKSETHPESGTVTYTYDAVGNVKTRTDAAFGATIHTYDGNNRLVFVDRPGTAYDTTLGYDASDNRTLLQNAYVRSTFTFDAANRLAQRKDELSIHPTRPQMLATAYTYDGNDRLATITYPSHTVAAPRKVQYTYDAAGRILSVVKPGSTMYASTFAYHPSGAPSSFKTGDGRTRNFSYSPRQRLKLIDSSVLRLRYAYEPNGNLSDLYDLQRATLDQTFGYDPLDRLTSVSHFSPGTFGYDVLGNRLSSTVGGPSSFAYDGATLRLTTGTISGDPQAWIYDANGNTREHKVSGVTAETYAFTPDNMVETATVGGAVTTYRYDGDGLRAGKEQGGLYRYYTRGPGGILSELTDSCTTGAESVRDYVYAGERLVAIIEPSPPVVALTASAATVTETPGAALAVSVKLTTANGCPTQGEVSVAYATVDGTAHAGSDYRAATGTLVFPVGSPSGTAQVVDVPLVNDTLIEPTEAFGFTVSAPHGAILGAVTNLTTTILDNDTPVVSWVAASASIPESGGTLELRARLTTAEGNSLNAAASVGYATANQTAVAPADYTAVSGTLTFASGTASGAEQSLSVPIAVDTLVEPNETFRFVLSGPVGIVIVPPAAATITIVDVSPVISAAAASLALLETAGPAEFPVRLTTPDGSPTLVPVTVSYATSNLTAKAPEDYAMAAGTLTFPAGTASGVQQVVAVSLVPDLLVEPDETFRFTLSKPLGGKLGAPSSTTVTIFDSSPVIALTTGALALSEGAGTIPLTVRLTTPNLAPTTAPVTVKFATVNGTAKAPADFTPASGTLSFPAGAPSGSEQVVGVTVVRDAVVESNETFRLVLSAPVGARLGALSVATVTLLDVSPSVAFVGPSVEAGEGTGGATAAVRLTTPDELPTTALVTVRFTTANLTAVVGADYAATVGILSFPAGTATGATLSATVLLKDDVLSEDDESFKLTLSHPTAARLGPQAMTTVKILDDDPLPGISIADATVTERDAGLANMTFKLSLSAPAGRLVSVSYATSDGSAVAPADYKAKSGLVSFPAGRTSAALTVSVVGDKVDEDNEAFLVTLTSPVKAQLDRETAQGVILDNDGLPSFCQPIVTVPYEITTSGRYCLGSNLSFEAAEGAAITVSADFVSLDLRGFSLSSTAGLETQARGIFAAGRNGILVRNGQVSGFLYGVQLDDTYPYASGGHRVERIRAESNTVAGIYVAGRNNVIRQCVVIGTGGLSEEGETGTETFGIAVVGPGAQVLDNDLSDTRGNGPTWGRSLFILHGQGTVVLRNRLVGESGATGLTVRESQDVLAVRNRFTGLGEGIVFEGESSGAYRGNLTSGVIVPFTGGTDAGGNE